MFLFLVLFFFFLLQRQFYFFALKGSVKTGIVCFLCLLLLLLLFWNSKSNFSSIDFCSNFLMLNSTQFLYFAGCFATTVTAIDAAAPLESIHFFIIEYKLTCICNTELFVERNIFWKNHTTNILINQLSFIKLFIKFFNP